MFEIDDETKRLLIIAGAAVAAAVLLFAGWRLQHAAVRASVKDEAVREATDGILTGAAASAAAGDVALAEARDPGANGH